MLFISSDYSAKDNSMYYETQYATTEVQTTNKSEYVVKKGDSLWNISKEHLKKKHVTNATNAEIQEMMYKIAKLNQKDSLEAINNIKADDIIYLPEEMTDVKNETCYVSDWFQRGPANSATSKPEIKVEKSGVQLAKETTEQIKKIIDAPSTMNYNQQLLYQARAKNNIPTELFTAHGKAGIKYWTELLSDEPKSSLIIEKTYSYSPTNRPTSLHIIKKAKNTPYSATEAHMYVLVDKSGKLKKVAFNTPGVRINSLCFDYELNNKGILSKSSNLNSKVLELEELPESEYSTLINKLQEHLDRELTKQ